jgi:hypothetical protein
MECRQRRGERAPQPQPDGRREAERRAGDADHGIMCQPGVDVGDAERTVAREHRKVDRVRRTIEQRGERGLRVLDLVRIELSQALGRAALARRGTQVEETSPRDGALRRGVAQHEAVLRRGGDRPLQHQLNEGFRARRDRRVAEQHHARAHVAGGVMQPRRHPLCDRLSLRAEHAQDRVDPVGRRMLRGIEHHVAARDRIL